MKTEQCEQAAALVWQHWNEVTRMVALPAECRPANRAESYAIQAAFAQRTGLAVSGWKIAATSVAGQQHIGVDGPLAGRLFADRVLDSGASISLDGNLMLVAEAEFTFRFEQALPQRAAGYTVDEVMAAVASLHCAIEVPDSRYHDFLGLGAPALIADNACASWFLLGGPTAADWRKLDLSQHKLTAFLNGEPVADGVGANALGDPRVALTWLVNELNAYGSGVQAGEIVTTGTCIKPVTIAPGDHLRVDYGVLGEIEARFT